MFYNSLNEKKVSNQVNETNLEYINIYGLFGTYNIEIPFDKQVNIFIGENGLGKTTILNCIYFILEKKFSRLANIQFNEIKVKFKDDFKPHKITIEDVREFNIKNRRNRGIFEEIFNDEILENISIEYDGSELKEEIIDKIDYLSYEISKRYDLPIRIAKRQLQYYIENKNIIYEKQRKANGNNVINLSKAISEKIKERIIYLPTYRRIEDDFASFNFRSDELNKAELLIRFGMSDVQNSINRILKKIQSLAMEGFREMTGILLKQYTDGSDLITNKEIDIDTVKIVLDRVGKEIEDPYKRKILDLMENNKIKDPKYLYLFDLINKLIDNYDLQKAYDDRIKKFTDTCNKYLNDKHFDYNQSTLKLGIYLDEKINDLKEPIELTQLSSGEKQIVSLFSKLYLESNDRSIIIIDEPELSLSIQWQKMLLPDIMRANSCNLLVTVTHSPFIFENEFDYDAKEMRRYRSNMNI